MNMKNIHKLIILVFSLMALSSCADDYQYVSEVASLTIVESDVVLPCQGGEGYIVLEDGSDASVETSASWLTARLEGNKVVLTAPANESLESRYSTVTVTSPNGTASVTAQQFGTLSADFSPSDIKAGGKAARFTFSYQYSVKIEASASEPWLSVETTDKELVVILDENTGDESRTGQVDWKLGGTTGTIHVTQRSLSASGFQENPNWVPGYFGRTTYQNTEVEVFGVEVRDNGASGKYIIAVCSESEFKESGCHSQADFMETFAQESIDYLKELIQKYPDDYSSLDDFTHTESTKEGWSLLDGGKYFVYAIGVDASGNPSGLFSYASCTISGGESDFTADENWSISYNGRYTQNGTQYEYVSYTALTNDSYYPVILTKTQYEEQYDASIGKLAPTFAAYVKKQGLAPKKGSQKLLYNKKDPGEYVAFMIGMDDNCTVTYHYAMLEFTISEEQTPTEEYKKWIGEWSLTAKNVAGDADSTYFNFTIVQNSANKSYGVSGWGGDYFVDFGNVIAQYDEETGNLVFRTYNVGENLDLYKDGRSWVVGLYGDIDIDGANSPVNGNNLKLATGTLSADGSKATIEANEVQLTTGERYKYVHMWWYGFSNDGHYVIYNGKRPPFPCSLSKIRSLGASSLIKVESNVISNNYEKASVDFRNGVAFVHSL